MSDGVAHEIAFSECEFHFNRTGPVDPTAAIVASQADNGADLSI